MKVHFKLLYPFIWLTVHTGFKKYMYQMFLKNFLATLHFLTFHSFLNPLQSVSNPTMERKLHAELTNDLPAISVIPFLSSPWLSSRIQNCWQLSSSSKHSPVDSTILSWFSCFFTGRSFRKYFFLLNSNYKCHLSVEMLQGSNLGPLYSLLSQRSL